MKEQDAFVTKNSARHRRQTTQEWKLHAEWKDGSTMWQTLKDPKEAHPVMVAECAVASGISHEPAFAWWVQKVPKKRDWIIGAVKKRHFRRQQKCGVELLKTVKRALEIDAKTNTTFWRDAIGKEMKAVDKAFEHQEEGAPNPVGHKETKCHMTLDTKADFLRKARLIAGGHMADPPALITCASVVSRESV